jgi:flagellar hook-associated protein 1 FlgK
LQLGRGVDAFGSPGSPLFAYTETAVTGSGRAAGTAGAAAPAPLPSVTVTFSNGLTGSITADLDSFFVAAAPPSGASAGDTASVRLTSANGAIDRILTTAPLAGGETPADLAVRLNDQVALDPQLAGLVTFSDSGGALKVVLSDQAKQGFTLSAATSNPAFTTGLEAGATLGGQSAEEIAAALNAQIALSPALDAARARFTAVAGELRLDADVAFDYAIADSDPSATGFASGLNGAAGRAGGANAAGTIAVTDIALSGIAAGSAERPGSADNLIALGELASAQLIGVDTLNSYFAGIVNSVGQQSEAAITSLETQTQVTAAAENLRDSFSGVDINEEAIELMRFEQGYSAMLRVMQTLGQLTDEVLQLAG